MMDQCLQSGGVVLNTNAAPVHGSVRLIFDERVAQKWIMLGGILT